MKAKNLLLIAFFTLFTCVMTSCSKDEPFNSPPLFSFKFNLVDEKGNHLINDNNIEWVKDNVTLVYNDIVYSIDTKSESSMQFFTQSYDKSALFFGSFYKNDFSGEFTINYPNGTYDEIDFDVKNYFKESPSIKVTLNGTDVIHENITIVKPADFLENLKNL